MPEVPNQPPESPPTAPGRDADGAAPARPAVATQPKPAWRRTWIVGAVLLTLLAFGLVWQRGLYNDDYANYAIHHDVATGARKSFFFMLGSVAKARCLALMLARNSVLMISDGHEALVRAMLGGAAALNAALVGWLVHRLLRSWFAATVAVLVALCAAPMHQALLWTTGGNYLLMMALTLAYVIAFLLAIEGVRPRTLWWLVGTLAFVGAILIAEQHIAIVGLLAILGMVAALRADQGQRWPVMRRALLVPLWPLLLGVLCYLFFYGEESHDISARGGLVTSLRDVYDHCKTIVRVTPNLFVSPQMREVLREGAVAGLQRVCSSPVGIGLLIVGSGLLLTVAGWRSPRKAVEAPWYAGVLLLVATLGGALVTLVFPLCLLAYLYLESRQVYVPYLLLAVAIATAVWLVDRVVRHDGFRRFVLCALAFLLIGNTLVMVGFAEAYARRSALDQRQLAAVTAVIRSDDLPRKACLVPLVLDHVTFPDYPALDCLLHGGFEIKWAAEGLLHVAYRRGDLVAAVPHTRDWGTRFIIPTDPEQAGQILIQGQPYDPANTLVFTWRDGEVCLIRDLHVMRGDVDNVVSFPLALPIAERGVPLMDVVVTEEWPVFELVEYEPPAAQSAPASQPGTE